MKSLSLLTILLVAYHLELVCAQAQLQDTVNSLTSSLTSGLTNGLFSGLRDTLQPGQQRQNPFFAQQQQMMPFGQMNGQWPAQMNGQMPPMGPMGGHWPPPPPPPPHHWMAAYQQQLMHQMQQQNQNPMGFANFQQGGQMGYPGNQLNGGFGQMSYPNFNQDPSGQFNQQSFPLGPNNQQGLPQNLNNQQTSPQLPNNQAEPVNMGDQVRANRYHH